MWTPWPPDLSAGRLVPWLRLVLTGLEMLPMPRDGGREFTTALAASAAD